MGGLAIKLIVAKRDAGIVRSIMIQDIGNITYGYLGSAAGFMEYDLLWGGDIASGITGYGWTDSPRDKRYINIGIDWYYR